MVGKSWTAYSHVAKSLLLNYSTSQPHLPVAWKELEHEKEQVNSWTCWRFSLYTQQFKTTYCQGRQKSTRQGRQECCFESLSGFGILEVADLSLDEPMMESVFWWWRRECERWYGEPCGCRRLEDYRTSLAALLPILSSISGLMPFFPVSSMMYVGTWLPLNSIKLVIIEPVWCMWACVYLWTQLS
jgi:hypothetical protein